LRLVKSLVVLGIGELKIEVSFLTKWGYCRFFPLYDHSWTMAWISSNFRRITQRHQCHQTDGGVHSSWNSGAYFLKTDYWSMRSLW
jgi:hypothetical protein